MSIPKVVKMVVYPVAGYDSMLLNLSGAHGPFFTRNVTIMWTDEGQMGVSEVPGGPKITKIIEGAKDFIIGSSIGEFKNILQKVRSKFAGVDKGGRGNQTYDERTLVHAVTALSLIHI